jgi:sigma-B regulation protein RsbU (phosphoserine phosphatase)
MFAERGLSPGEVLTKVNNTLVKDFPKTRFVTMVYAIVNPSGKNIVFSNAGHPPPLFTDSEGGKFLNFESGLPLGIQEGSFPEHSFELPSGSRLLFYSDGITEAMNQASEEYGDKRIFEQMINPSSTIKNLLDGVQTFVNGFPASDDMTVVMIKSKD